MSRLKRLRSISPEELRVRGAQMINALAERRGWSRLAKLPTNESVSALFDQTQLPPHSKPHGLLEHFRTRTLPQFFSSFADREATVTELRRRWPEAEKALIEKADRILGCRFDLLGLRDLSFGDPIDWRLEPLSGKRTPLVHWSRLNYLDAAVAGDKKIVWELNRHQYFMTLGQAYWLTRDERYAETFAAHLGSWMDQNPPKLGINWASSLEVGFRAISWLWAFHFFKDSAALTPELFLRAMKFLYLHARHLETYLSTYFSPNTHLTGEALALYYLGTLLPEFRDSGRWRETGKRILLEQLPIHVRADGVYFEQSSFYHRYTTDFYTHFLVLARANGDALPLEVVEKLTLLLDHLMYITRPDGTTPFFGDDDGGRLVMLDQRAGNNFRAALATGAALFDRGDYKQVAGEAAEETLWLLGSQGLGAFDRLQSRDPEKQSVAFPNGGYYVMRDGWKRTANYLLLDCGPHGMSNCGHAHADALSFDLAAHGRTMLIDPGTYTYTGSKEGRDWFRSTKAHNALTVDGESSSTSAGPFSWTTIAKCRARSWISRDRFDFFAGEHDGFERLDPPVTYSRSVLFLKKDYWVMRDQVSSAGEHTYDLRFHWEAGTGPGMTADGVAGLQLASFAKGSAWHSEEGSVSHCYREREPAGIDVFSLTASGSEDLITFLLPRSGSELRFKVREVEAIGGRAFEVVSDTTWDLVMIRTAARVETARLASDFEWTWARFASEKAAVPEELTLVGGQNLELQGKEILRSGRRINYLVASRSGDQFRVETDDGVLELSLPIHDFEALFGSRQPATPA